jgi:DNA-binding beta-propeller fold protein YncE
MRHPNGLRAASGVVGGWTLENAAYSGVSFNVSVEDNTPAGLFFRSDGVKMYMVGSSLDNINEYTLSTPWNISTASYIRSFFVRTQNNVPTGIFFKEDGTKMYMAGNTSSNINEYDLSTPWNISTASYLRTFSFSGQDSNPQDIYFRDDGTKLFMVGSTGNAVYEYTLSTAWNISTASFVQSTSVASEDTDPTGLFFKPNGAKMFIVGTAGDAVYEYILTSGWNISTRTFVRSFSVTSQETNPTGLFFKSDGNSMYVVGTNTDTVYAYNL